MIATLDQVRATFAGCCKAEGQPSKAAASAAKKIEAAILRWYKSVLPGLVEWATSLLPADAGAASKADPPDLDAGGMYDELADALVAGVTAGAVDAASVSGLDLESPPVQAVQYAKDHAAELVGKKLIAGQLVDNPDPKYSISKATRERTQELVTEAIEEGWSPSKLSSRLRAEFGQARAQTIARTETGFAYGKGAHEVYQEASVEMVEILDGAGCLPIGHDDNAGAPSGTPGVMEPDREANGQVWTLAQYASALIAHPNCVRGAVPYIPSED